ncbi:MAG: SPFH domain-containing protein [Fimbriimonadaceae bacterium]
MTKEKQLHPVNGWLMLVVVLGIWAGLGYMVYSMISEAIAAKGVPGSFSVSGGQVGLMIGLFVLEMLLMPGFFIVPPNTSRVMVLFGKYAGTAKDDGFWWSNPFFTKMSLSLRAQTLNGERLKVNDSVGNPVEIAAIIIWQVEDTYKASFDVENLDQFVDLQSETALRHLASSYPYDAEDEQISLMRHTDEVATHLLEELQERLKRAGVRILEARLSHLAYAQEIAGTMLRKQQAAAIIAARQRIVDGAVGMVEMALSHLAERKIVELDPERKAAMVCNLMVVLCSESAVQPVLNAGTLQP